MLFLDLSNILIFILNFNMWKYEFYLSTVITKSIKITQEDVQRILGTSLRSAPSRVRWSQKSRQATDEERC